MMIARRVIKVTNPAGLPRKRVKRKSAAVHRRPQSVAGNPAHLLHLGFFNPKQKRRTEVAKTKRKAINARRAHKSNARHRKVTAINRRHHQAVHRAAGNRGGHRRNAATRVIVMKPVHNAHKRRLANPTFFGQTVNAVKLTEYVVGGLVGVALNRAVLPLLPATWTANNWAATALSVGIAVLEWWGASMIDKEFGSAVGFGALMNAASQALNAFVPQVGSVIGLSGRRGTGDLVPAHWTIPENPFDTISGGGPTSGVVPYPSAYRVAA